MSERNKASLRRAIEELYGKGNIAVADELIAADCIDHDPLPGQAAGREGFKQSAAMLHAAFPDMQLTFAAMLADGDLAAARWTMRATHQGPLLGVPPTGKTVTITGSDLVRIADGQIVEWWHNEDVLGLLQQLGVAPALGRS